LLEVALDEGGELGNERLRLLEQQRECLARRGKLARALGEQLRLRPNSKRSCAAGIEPSSWSSSASDGSPALPPT